MLDLSCDIGNAEDTSQPSHDSATPKHPCNDDVHHSDTDGLDNEAWAIRVPTELKRKLAVPWQTSIILKIMGCPLGYQALQTRLASIWRPRGMMHLIDIGYGYFIMRFDLVKDYQHALMDAPWFVGDQYLHVQAWGANFHPHIAKISTTAIWIRLENLPIEYYHPDFLKHVGYKLGKLLKVDAITSAAIRGRYARLYVQINTANPLLKRLKLEHFWQDIIYENLPLLCYRCGRLGHQEIHCSKAFTDPHTKPPQIPITHGDQGAQDHDQEQTPWKTVQTRRARVCGFHTELSRHGKLPSVTPRLRLLHVSLPFLFSPMCCALLKLTRYRFTPEQHWHGDPNSKPANETRTTTPAHSLLAATDSCPSVPLSAPLSSTSGASKGPTSQAKENPGELL
uniref:CCHC-type domain-containing protein n=1 Tax=Quercus lobata TaxID=97700 RepID=A0A7N2R4Z1_QUELO